MALSSIHIVNLNRSLKNIKSDVIADFIYMDQYEIIITTNKIAFSLDLQTIERYVKNTNMTINPSVIKIILKNNHIFNNISITLKSYIIKVLPKLNIVIVWLNI